MEYFVRSQGIWLHALQYSLINCDFNEMNKTVGKLALINREKKRAKLVQKYAKKREDLMAAIADESLGEVERYEARLKLQALPRNANPTRQRNRCQITGRPRGVFRKFGLCRNKLRELAFAGEVPGLIKASW